MRQATLLILFALIFCTVGQHAEAQKITKSSIIVTTTLDLDLSSSSQNVTAYPNSVAYPDYYELNMRVTAFVNTGQYGRFYLYPQRRVSGTFSWSSFVPNVTQFPNTGPTATPSATYSGTAKTLQLEGTKYDYRVKVVFFSTSGGSKTVYTPIRWACVLGVPKACFTMYNVVSSQSENSYYGPQTVNNICQNAVTINGSCSEFEEGYHIRIAEFNLSTWTFVEDYYSGWVGSGEAPSFISLNALAASNGKYFTPGKLYIVALSIGPVWQSSPPQFFRVLGSCRTSGEGLQLPTEETTSMVEESALSVNVKAYPNPTENAFKISIDNIEVNNNASIKVFDRYGAQIYQGALKSNTTEINTSNWKTGIYFCQIQVGNKIETKKIVKK